MRIHRLSGILAAGVLSAAALALPASAASAAPVGRHTAVAPPAAVAHPAAVANAAGTSVSEDVLLVHGYGDNCISAFAPDTITSNTDPPPSGPNGLHGAESFLSRYGFSNLHAIGYYSGESANKQAQGCDYAVQDVPDVGTDPAKDKCAPIPHTHQAPVYSHGVVVGYQTVEDTGTNNDPIRHVACRLAWFIHDKYTSQGQPVRILAHSMGGLVVREAIGESGRDPVFPPALRVDRVVTVASPHGGLGGAYLANARLFAGSQEVEDMAVGSAFMSEVGQFQAPQGEGGTFWGLIAGSQSCAHGELPIIHPSCVQGTPGGNPWPSGDGVIQAESALAMRADTKVLYGVLDYWDSGGVPQAWTADAATQYGHEWGSGGLGVYIQPPYYLNDDGTAPTRAWVCSNACTSTTFGDMHLGANTTRPVDRALTEIARLLSTYTVGHARYAGNDYPYDGLGQFEHQGLTDAWHEYDGQCDSFAAWKVYETLGGTARADAATIPAAGFSPADRGISPVVGYAGAGAPASNWGDARDWGRVATANNWPVDNRPSPGSIAWWNDQGTGMPVGHVGYVTDVYPDGSITVESYNLRANGQYSTIHLTPGGTDDTSFHLPAWHVVWPTGFVHIGDVAATMTPTPQPAPAVAFHYPHNTYGPGDGGSFSLAGATAGDGDNHGWYTRTGHGDIGQELWTNSHPGAADSTATWSPPLAASQCYEVDAFVPDNYSNNAAALYTVTDQHFGTSLVPINENLTTNDYSELGVFQARPDGTLPVTLTDQGASGGYVAADGMRFVRQPDCTGATRTSQTVDRANGMTLAGTTFGDGDTNGWYPMPGHGQRGNGVWTNSGGTATSSSATWNPTLQPNTCYQLQAYVPDQHSNNYQAAYQVHAGGGTPTVTVNENAFTNGFAALGTYRSDGSGHLSVVLTDQGTAATFVTADTMSFIRVGCPSAVQGPTYPALTAGPGSPLTQFSVVSDWYNQFGHGDLGYEKWTHTNGASPVSVASWNFTGLVANACYAVDAFVPDNYANNTQAKYQAHTSSGSLTTVVNQANTTGWTSLGVLLPGGDGKLTVTLDDTGPVGTYTAADAVRLTRTC